MCYSEIRYTTDRDVHDAYVCAAVGLRNDTCELKRDTETHHRPSDEHRSYPPRARNANIDPKSSSKMFSSKTLAIFDQLATSAFSTPLPPQMYIETDSVQDAPVEFKSADFPDVSDWRHLEAEWCLLEAGPGFWPWVHRLLGVQGLDVSLNVDRPCSLYCHDDSDSGLSEDELINPNRTTYDTDSQSGLSEDELLPPQSNTCVLCL